MLEDQERLRIFLEELECFWETAPFVHKEKRNTLVVAWYSLGGDLVIMMRFRVVLDILDG